MNVDRFIFISNNIEVGYYTWHHCMKMNFRKAAHIVTLLVVVCACSLDYQEAIVEEKLSETLPDTVLIDFTHAMVQDNRVIAKIEAERAETYGQKHETLLLGVHFLEQNEHGDIVTEGWVDRAVYHTDTENSEISGSISFQSYSEGIHIYAEELSWKKEEKWLESSAEQTVRLERDDGSFVEGKGFSADFRRKLVKFRFGVKGQYVQTD